MNNSAFTIHIEDEHFLLVEKPAALHTAPLKAGEKENLLAEVIYRYPEIAALPGRKDVEPGLLHRLDYETSGLVLIARTAMAFKNLSEQFEQNHVSKLYYTVSLCRKEQIAGSPHNTPVAAWRNLLESWSPETERADFFLQSRFRPWGPGRRLVKVITDESSDRKRAEITTTCYSSDLRLLNRRGNVFLVRACIFKGFRHQVRAHLAYLGLPIAGDPLYLVPQEAHPSPVAWKRMYLHAAGLRFCHPATGQVIDYQTPVPGDFAAMLDLHPGNTGAP